LPPRVGWHVLPPPKKMPIRTGRFGPPFSTWFLGPSRIHNPNGISIGSAVFAGYTTVTDRPTDHARYSICNNGRIRTTSMRPKNCIIIIRPQRCTAYIDAAYCYRPSIASSVGVSVCHTSERCKNGCTDRDAIWVEDSGKPNEQCVRWGPESPMGRGNFRRKRRPIVKYRDTAVICAKTAEPIEMPFGLLPSATVVALRNRGCHLLLLFSSRADTEPERD